MTIERKFRAFIQRARGRQRAAAIDAYAHLVAANFSYFEGRRGIEQEKRVRAEYPGPAVFAGMARLSGRRNASAMLWENALGVEGHLSAPQRSELRALLGRLVTEGVLPEPTGGYGEHWETEQAEATASKSRHPRQSGFGVPYVPTPERPAASKREPFRVDPDQLDRATRGHARTQNRLGEVASSRGLDVRSSGPGEPDFDIGWSSEGKRTIAEVKTINARNEDKQLRLGLGQLLDYHDQLTAGSEEVALVLATDHEPSNVRWDRVCHRHGVRLVWPETFENAFVFDDG